MLFPNGFDPFIVWIDFVNAIADFHIPVGFFLRTDA
jgi:hypothetical protein